MIEQKFEQEQTPRNYELPPLELLSRGEEKPDFNFVSIRSILESDEWRNCKAEIPLILGKDPKGKNVIIDLTKAPHILMAGGTGSGKSVCMDTMIMSLLFRFRPDELKIIMVDPKYVELQGYRSLPHLMTPLINNPEKTPQMLDLVIHEMEQRYQQLTQVKARDLNSFNQSLLTLETMMGENNGKIPRKLPRLVIIINELADLMMTNAWEKVESSICKIAQRGRAVGIHLVISTQAPRRDFFTSIIKANFPTKITFKVAVAMDSRLILDTDGAEKLRGFGDMLFKGVGDGILKRIQGAMTNDSDIQKVVDFVSAQAAPQDDEQVRKDQHLIESAPPPELPADIKKYIQPDDPPLTVVALLQILHFRRCSALFLQTNLKISYNQAVELLDLFEERGVIERIASHRYKILIQPEADEEEI